MAIPKYGAKNKRKGENMRTENEIEVLAKKIAEAGARFILLVGAAGSGKTMVARRLVKYLEAPTMLEIAEINAVHGMAKLLGKEGHRATLERPFRAPHHTVSGVGLIGGSFHVGEIDLAHAGVLFLDELSEFSIHTVTLLGERIDYYDEISCPGYGFGSPKLIVGSSDNSAGALIRTQENMARIAGSLRNCLVVDFD